MEGIRKVTEKPVAAAASLADHILIVIDGKLFRATVESLEEVLTEGMASRPMAEAMKDEDTVVIIQNGSVRRAKKSTVSSMPMRDEETGEDFKMELVVRDGKLNLDLTRITE